MEFLVFPEEYFRGPKPLLRDIPLLFQNDLRFLEQF